MIRSILSCALGVALASGSVVAAGRVHAVSGLDATATTLGALDDAGTVVVAISTTDPLGTNAARRPQVFAWDVVNGTPTQVTVWDRGVEADPWGPALSDDGTWVAVASRSDPLGTNPGHHVELFLARVDGSDVRQLTALADPDAILGHYDLAGSGNRLVFESNADPLGTNPARVGQLFVVDADGDALAQLTNHLTDDIQLLWPSISDDGERIAYESSDGTIGFAWQVFAILADGTGRRQLAEIPFRTPGRVAISGDGSTVAFETIPGSLPPPQGGCFGGDQIAVVDWNGTGLHLVTGVCLGDAAPGQAFSPTLTDDGGSVVYAANAFGTWNIERVPKSGFPATPLTAVGAEPGPTAECLAARVSGAGERIAFQCRGGEPFGGPNPDLSEELFVMDGDGMNPAQRSDGIDGASIDPAIAAAARRVAWVSDANPLDEPGYWFPQVYVSSIDGDDVARVTSLSGGAVRDVSIASAGTPIVFTHDGDPLGANEAGFEVFAVEADGSDLRQLTPSRPGTLPSNGPHLAENGSRVVLQSTVDLLETGLLDTLWRVYTVSADGTGLTRLTDDGLAAEPHPRIDPTGTWVVYVADGDVVRDRFDGGLTVSVTTHGDVQRADVATGGDRVVYAAAADPLGTNQDLNTELFLRDVAAGTTSQLTTTASGNNLSPAFSGDGAWVHFWSDAPHHGEGGDGLRVPFRVRVSDGVVERTGGLAGCGTFEFEGFLRPPATGTVDDLVAFGVPGDCAGDNRPDHSQEVFAADRAATARITPGKTSPTVVTWDVESGPARYDVVRGDVAALAVAGDRVDLGPVACIEDDSTDATTAGHPDPELPASGQAFFYLHRGAQGPTDAGSYGTSSQGVERLPASGDCPGGV
jgi:Tol biopolymer transport system component